MPVFVLLSTLTDEFKEKLRNEPELLLDVCCKMEGYNQDILSQIVTLGPYNFLNIVEVKDEKAIYRISEEMDSTGNMKTLVMPALPLREYVEKVKNCLKSHS